MHKKSAELVMATKWVIYNYYRIYETNVMLGTFVVKSVSISSAAAKCSRSKNLAKKLVPWTRFLNVT